MTERTQNDKQQQLEDNIHLCATYARAQIAAYRAQQLHILVDSLDSCYPRPEATYGFLPTVTPFGLTGAPGCSQTLMNNMLRPHLDDFAMVYLDDILIYGKKEQEHVKHLRMVLELLRKNKLYAKLSKCGFMKTEIDYLGHVISREGIKVKPRKIEAVQAREPLKNVTRVQSFLGLCNDYRKFIKNFAMIATPLTDLTRNGIEFKWEERQINAFQRLKEALTRAPVLRCADPALRYEITTDASETGIGGVLTQTDETRCKPIAFASKRLNPTEQGYPTHERVHLAIIYALGMWRPYLHGSSFVINTDHHPLKYLET